MKSRFTLTQRTAWVRDFDHIRDTLRVMPTGRIAVVEIAQPGGAEVLRMADRPRPEPGPGELLIRVAAAGVNRPDILQRQGKYAPPPGVSDIPGLEVAGTVEMLGAGVSGWSVGDPVCALVAGGGYAEYCVAPSAQCLPVPKGLSLVEAAAIPETFFTVWHNVFERGRLAKGEVLLVHGGSSGIGTTAIQLGRAFGARVLATAGNAEKCRACELLGAERAINYKDDDFAAVVKEATGGRGADVILDMVGGDYTPRNVQCLTVEGRLVQIAFLRGSKVELDLRPVMHKRLTVTGSTLRPRPVEEKGAIARALHENVWPLLERGEVRPVIFQTFTLAQAAEAHRLMESSRHIGKLVLRPIGVISGDRSGRGRIRPRWSSRGRRFHGIRHHLAAVQRRGSRTLEKLWRSFRTAGGAGVYVESHELASPDVPGARSRRGQPRLRARRG
jgi:putative PIG3 family NAD(P)H quinone oxidoreductase